VFITAYVRSPWMPKKWTGLHWSASCKANRKDRSGDGAILWELMNRE